MDVLTAVKSRRSVRSFSSRDVPEKTVEEVLEAGRWAPSGLNNQPWRFKVVRDEALKERLASCTKYGGVVRSAPVSIAVFLDAKESYDRTKDLQAIGACIQNMLLAAHSLGLGAVWLGEILNNRVKAEAALGSPTGCELMAVVALGWPAGKNAKPGRKSLKDLMLA